MEKLKDEQIIALFNKNGYKIIGDIKNSTTNILCEKDEYWYRISYHNLDYGKKPSLWGFHNIDNLEHNIDVNIKKRKASSKFISYKVIKHRQKNRILLTFECECGKEFNKVLEDAIYNKHLCCQDCLKDRVGHNRRKGEKHLSTIEKAGYKIIENIINPTNSEYIEVEDKLGYKGFVRASRVSSGKGMSKFDARINKKHYVENVNHYAELNGVDIECLDFVEKRHTRQSLLFRCSCGNEFITSLASFQNGKVRCEICAKSISRYELKFKKYLDDNNIKYIYQYSLNQCRDVLPLPFDFFILGYNFLVEIDGEGHFYPCNFNQTSDEKAKISFDTTVRHDKIKNKFCEDNSIKLLRIPYTKFKDGTYKEIFQNFIEEVASLS